MSQAASYPFRQSRGLLVGAAALIAATLLVAIPGHRAPVDPAAAGMRPVAERGLLFADRADGGILVRDARTGRVIEELPAGTEGFLRGALRGLARDRLRAGHGPDVPFRLSAWADGRITLEDTATGVVMELHAFGRGNAEAFLNLMARGD
jgi:putative photosynthetic complex assembly protein